MSDIVVYDIRNSQSYNPLNFKEGEERFEYVRSLLWSDNKYCNYAYKASDGTFIGLHRSTLEECRIIRDQCLKRYGLER